MSEPGDSDRETEAELRKTPMPAPAGGLSLSRLVPLIVIAAAFAAFFAFDLNRFLSFDALSENREALLAWQHNNTTLAIAAFVALYAVVVALSLPGAIWMTIGGGFLFGATLGTILVVVAATIGASAIFLVARYALGDVLRARAGPAIRKMEVGFRDNALSYLLVLRLVPLFPFWLVNLVPAFLGVPLRTFVIGTFVGIIPGSFVYILVGNGLGAVFDAGEKPDLDVIFKPEILAPIAGLVLLSLLPIVYKRLRRARGAPDV